jgi:hypothetical protein
MPFDLREKLAAALTTISVPDGYERAVEAHERLVEVNSGRRKAMPLAYGSILVIPQIAEMFLSRLPTHELIARLGCAGTRGMTEYR